MDTQKLNIPNISCHHCVHTIINELEELPGVKSVEGDVATKQVSVTYEAPATMEKIKTLLAEINYPVAA
ncbi:MAG: heavy-metal-associated domain-containing protein [Chloroflexi bacterium]|jgi:copper chaperone CopZ|nr:heavy-metal-associated domain-containing protein [Chloroflexota bacterium]